MKRFYEAATVGDAGAILLDGRPVRTPARRPLAVPSPTLADAIAGEWGAQGEKLDPRTMPLTGLANAAIDHAATDPSGFAAPLAAYARSDLLCYRAEGPSSLVARQAVEWDPPLAWARARYDVAFVVTSGIVPVAQPPATVARLAEAVTARDAFALAALAPLVTVSGSLILALAVAERAMTAEEALAAATLDEQWQVERWGDDPLAVAPREERRRDFLAAARFLDLL